MQRAYSPAYSADRKVNFLRAAAIRKANVDLHGAPFCGPAGIAWHAHGQMSLANVCFASKVDIAP
jgi:hypothetical protein